MRSVCSLTCKCSYVPTSGWQEDFFRQIGLQELHEREYAQIGAKTTRDILVAGMPVGKGLSKSAAEELGLVEGTAVGSALIDAQVQSMPMRLMLILDKLCRMAWDCCRSLYREWESGGDHSIYRGVATPIG